MSTSELSALDLDLPKSITADGQLKTTFRRIENAELRNDSYGTWNRDSGR